MLCCSLGPKYFTRSLTAKLLLLPVEVGSHGPIYILSQIADYVHAALNLLLEIGNVQVKQQVNYILFGKVILVLLVQNAKSQPIALNKNICLFHCSKWPLNIFLNIYLVKKPAYFYYIVGFTKCFIINLS